MKDVMTRALLFEGRAMISVWDITAAAQKGAALHGMSDDAANIYGKLLSVTAYMGAGLKNPTDRLTVSIDGDGKLGRAVACAEAGCKIRGYVSEPKARLRAGEQPSAMLGEGVIGVIRDLGMESPYRGVGRIVKGELRPRFRSPPSSKRASASSAAARRRCLCPAAARNISSCSKTSCATLPTSARRSKRARRES